MRESKGVEQSSSPSEKKRAKDMLVMFWSEYSNPLV